ncbi:MAG: glycosyltransferase family 2 protein [Amedibacillus dolichus]|uniref:Glycosyltransferase family 2 protein n=1 Tax=Amedibacillus dolichus TaxID=31971 RepID=A0A942WH33_9FIRM|nr:glycosyltransferase family 2 protein [Amedibacillus dolichus]MBS4884436.1 glycosyltransferase family 2 protein [Amedibacillus dolichus]
MKISILMLTYNAPNYVYESINTVKKMTEDVDYELIVVDNCSRFKTRNLLKKLYKQGYIDKLFLNRENSLFAKGNNIASSFCSDDSDYILLLNSDICINNGKWLRNLLEIHPKEGGISAYGLVTDEPIRADGYCLLIDRYLYDKYKLDASYAWFWGVTKLESKILQEQKKIKVIKNHENMIHHYGGKSGNAFKNAPGMNTDIEEIKEWFKGHSIEIIDSI